LPGREYNFKLPIQKKVFLQLPRRAMSRGTCASGANLLLQKLAARASRAGGKLNHAAALFFSLFLSHTGLIVGISTGHFHQVFHDY
jgi:hypothetical protein